MAEFTRTEHKVDPRFKDLGTAGAHAHVGPKQGRTTKGAFMAPENYAPRAVNNADATAMAKKKARPAEAKTWTPQHSFNAAYAPSDFRGKTSAHEALSAIDKHDWSGGGSDPFAGLKAASRDLGKHVKDADGPVGWTGSVGLSRGGHSSPPPRPSILPPGERATSKTAPASSPAPNRATPPAERQRGLFTPRAEHEKTHTRSWFDPKVHPSRVTSSEPTPADAHVAAANANAGPRKPTKGDLLGQKHGTMRDHLAAQAAKKQRRQTVGMTVPGLGKGWKQGSGRHSAGSPGRVSAPAASSTPSAPPRAVQTGGKRPAETAKPYKLQRTREYLGLPRDDNDWGVGGAKVTKEAYKARSTQKVTRQAYKASMADKKSK